MRRMKRHNPKKKKRSNPPASRRRRRRNPEAAAPAEKKPRKKPITGVQRLAAALASGKVTEAQIADLRAAGVLPQARRTGGPKQEPKWKRDGFDNAQQAKDAAAASRAARDAESTSLKAVKADIRRRMKAGEPVTAEERAAVARAPRKARSLAARAKGERGFKRKMPTKGRGFAAGRRVVQGRAIALGSIPKDLKDLLGPMITFNKAGKPVSIRSARSYAASEMNKKTSSKGSKKIASAWRSAQLAQRYAATPAERAQLRAMGLDSVPNPSVMSVLGDIKTLMPQISGAAVGFVAAAALGEAALKFGVPDAHKEKGWAKAVPSVASLAIGAAGFAALRMSKNRSISSAAPYVLAGGVLAAVVHAIVRVKVGDQTIAKKLGLPLGEYAAMAGYGEYASMAGYGMGEYASMAGGSTYSGEQGIFAGLDDADPVLSGTDDEDEVDFTETLADEGVNVDEGSLNGSIFD